MSGSLEKIEELRFGERGMWSGIMGLGPGLAGLNSGENHQMMGNYNYIIKMFQKVRYQLVLYFSNRWTTM